MRVICIVLLFVVSNSALPVEPIHDSLCRNQNLKILRHLSLRGGERKQYSGLIKLLEDRGLLDTENKKILHAFSDCWADFKKQKISQGFDIFNAAWDEQNQVLVFKTPDKRFEFKPEANKKLPARIHKTVKALSGYPDAQAVPDVIWFLWTEAIIASLKNRYNHYIYAEELGWYKATSSGRIFTVGFSPTFKDGVIYVDDIVDDELEHAGLKRGTPIKAINSDYIEVSAQLDWWWQQNPFKYSVLFDLNDRLVSINADSVPRFSQAVQFRIFDDIAYIRIEYFDGRTGLDLMRYFRQIDDSITGIILDLRDNPGGVVTSIAADLFLKPSQTVLVMKKNDGEQSTYSGTIVYYPQNVIVLQNRNTVSMAEIVSAMLRSQQRATVIGERTYGKSVGQETYEVGLEGAVMLVDAQYFYPDGESHWGDNGVEPDIEIELSEEDKVRITELLFADEIDMQALIKNDPYVIKAVQLLGE